MKNIDDRCPDCGEEYIQPAKARCICGDPCIQPGKHIHIQCPVHGDVKVYGARTHWLQSPPNGTTVGSRWFTEFGKASKRMAPQLVWDQCRRHV